MIREEVLPIITGFTLVNGVFQRDITSTTSNIIEVTSVSDSTEMVEVGSFSGSFQEMAFSSFDNTELIDPLLFAEAIDVTVVPDFLF